MTATESTNTAPAKMIDGVEELANDEALHNYLIAKAGAVSSTILAHADDGVIWGRIDNRNDGATPFLLAPHSVALSLTSLQTLRLFNLAFEVLLWRTGRQWRSRIICDAATGDATWKESFDEMHLLWGTHVVETKDGFSVLEHGVEGLRHAVPLRHLSVNPESGKLTNPLALKVRHYLTNTGPARIEASRLVDIVQL